MWKVFLNEPLFIAGFFRLFKSIDCSELDFYTDASGVIGFGGICNQSWFVGSWPKYLLGTNPSIEFLELYAVACGTLFWIKNFKNSRICIFCGNEA